MKERIIVIDTCELTDDEFESMLNAIQRDQGALITHMREEE